MRPTIFATLCLMLAAPTQALANDKQVKTENVKPETEVAKPVVESIVSTQLIIYKFALNTTPAPKPKTLLSPEQYYNAPINDIVYPFLEINLKKLQKSP